MNTKSSWGGRREGAGRPSVDRSVKLFVRISEEAAKIIENVKNKSELIDKLIKDWVR